MKFTREDLRAAIEMDPEAMEVWCSEHGLEGEYKDAFYAMAIGKKMMEVLPEKMHMDKFNAAVKLLLRHSNLTE